MKITIETDNKHLLTEYIEPNEVKASSSENTTQSSSVNSSTAYDPFQTLLSDAAKQIAEVGSFPKDYKYL